MHSPSRARAYGGEWIWMDARTRTQNCKSALSENSRWQSDLSPGWIVLIYLRGSLIKKQQRPLER